MIRSVANKVMWVGRTTSIVLGLALVLAVIFGVASMALAAVPGDPFRLGRLNTISALTELVGRRDGAMLRVENNSTGAQAHALNLRVASGKVPLKVNSAAKVANLNSDELDGMDASALMPARTYAVEATIVMGTQVTGTTRVIFCDDGDVPISGGFSGLGPQTQIKQSSRVVYLERPTWWVGANKPVGSEDTWTAQAVCADFGELHQ
jgi:hypothetical protein